MQSWQAYNKLESSEYCINNMIAILYTVAYKRNATDYFLTLKAYNLPTTSAKVIILYLF